MVREACRAQGREVAVQLPPALGAALPPRLLILRQQAPPHLAVRLAVALVRRAGHPAEAADQETIALPTFLMRPDGWAVPRQHWPFKVDKRR